MSDKLKDKLYNYEIIPPARVWAKVMAALDESHLTSDFPSTLYHAAVTPPASAWEKIEAELEAARGSAKPQRRRIAPFLRYAAAAVFIGAIAFAGFQLLKGRPGQKETAAEKIIAHGKDNTAPAPHENNSENDNTTAAAEEARNDAALEASKHTFAKLDMSVSNRIKITRNNFFTKETELENTGPRSILEETYRELHDAGRMPASIAHQELKVNLASRYIMLMTPDGNIIRMSKKLSDLVCCVSGEEQNEDCIYQMKRWREKIACTPVASSPGNFMDILDLVSSLQEINH